MKTYSRILFAALSATALFSASAHAQRIDPATGLPVATGNAPARIDPVTGLPAAPAVGATAPSDPQNVLSTAKALTEEGSYEEALQRYLRYFEESRHDAGQRGVRLSFALSDWIELGRRYPQAKQALVKIRDDDTREFSKGRGYFDLFQEVSSLNHYLGDDDATYTLFKSLQDKPLARQCFAVVEDLLVQRHEYTLCLDYIGDPQANFDRFRQTWEQMKRWEDQQSARQQETARRMQELAKTNPAFANVPSPSFPPLPKFADNHFVKQTRQLIEILVGANRTADAEKIRDQAAAALDDARLKSAITDAERAIRQERAAN